ncbi:MAG TPA: hypothetical protein VF733_01160 [Candidatus Saccharimonadales bacterium]
MFNPNLSSTLPDFIDANPVFGMDAARRMAVPAAVVLALSGCGAPYEGPVCGGISVELKSDKKTVGMKALVSNETRNGVWKPERYDFSFGDGSRDDENDSTEDHTYKPDKQSKVYAIGARMIVDVLQNNEWVKDGASVSCPGTTITIPGTEALAPTTKPVTTTTTPPKKR